MNGFLSWTLAAIREEGSSASWMEEKRYDWVQLAAQAVSQILEGKAVIVVTDADRRWFGEYVVTTINRSGKNRPLLPFFTLEALFPGSDRLSKDEMGLLLDMLSLAFSDFFFFYVGQGHDPRANVAKTRDNSFMWIMDEQFPLSLQLHSYDPQINFQLLTLFRLFDKTIDAALFGEVELSS